MEHQKIIDALKKKDFSPIYLLQGEEPYYIDEVIQYAEANLLDEGEKSFNQVVLYGKETNAKQVIDQAMQYPMMSSHRVVILKEAQYMSSFEDLSSYFKNPSPQSLLFISYKNKSLDKRKAAWKALKDKAIVMTTKKLYDNQVPGFITQVVKHNKLKIENQTTRVIAEHLGADLSKISNEIEKIALNLQEGNTITLDHVQEYVGISKDYNIFELQKAIGQKDKIKCYKIIKYFSQNKKAHPIQMNVGALFSYFTKLFLTKKYERSDSGTLASKLRISPYFTSEYKSAAKNYSVADIKKAFGLLHIMDKHSKGVDSRYPNELSLYQEFLFKLFA